MHSELRRRYQNKRFPAVQGFTSHDNEMRFFRLFG